MDKMKILVQLVLIPLGLVFVLYLICGVLFFIDLLFFDNNELERISITEQMQIIYIEEDEEGNDINTYVVRIYSDDGKQYKDLIKGGFVAYCSFEDYLFLKANKKKYIIVSLSKQSVCYCDASCVNKCLQENGSDSTVKTLPWHKLY